MTINPDFETEFAAAHPLYMLVQNVIAGHPIEHGWYAAQMTLTVCVGQASADFAIADAAIDAIAADMKADVRGNWDLIKQAHADAQAARGGGHA